jgi:hypothetical protein
VGIRKKGGKEGLHLLQKKRKKLFISFIPINRNWRKLLLLVLSQLIVIGGNILSIILSLSIAKFKLFFPIICLIIARLFYKNNIFAIIWQLWGNNDPPLMKKYLIIK